MEKRVLIELLPGGLRLKVSPVFEPAKALTFELSRIGAQRLADALHEHARPNTKAARFDVAATLVEAQQRETENHRVVRLGDRGTTSKRAGVVYIDSSPKKRRGVVKL